jgi:alkyl hydroperoxide reductase subunit AhpF
MNAFIEKLQAVENADKTEAAEAETTYDILIIGSGPAGASLACFLASHGRTSWTKQTKQPRKIKMKL